MKIITNFQFLLLIIIKEKQYRFYILLYVNQLIIVHLLINICLTSHYNDIICLSMN
jgi:hypothetical protein